MIIPDYGACVNDYYGKEENKLPNPLITTPKYGQNGRLPRR
jgi:hypothetical protein